MDEHYEHEIEKLTIHLVDPVNNLPIPQISVTKSHLCNASFTPAANALGASLCLTWTYYNSLFSVLPAFSNPTWIHPPTLAPEYTS